MAKPRFLFLASDYASFVSHKAALTQVAADAGFEVVVAANRRKAPAAALANVRLVDLGWTRGGGPIKALFKALSEMADVRALLAEVDPAVVHAIDLKPAVIASLAMAGRRGLLINSINGLGFAFTDPGPAARLIRRLCGVVLRGAARRGARIVVQNPDDADVLRTALAVPAASVAVIRGSGVDPEAFSVAPLPPPRPFRILAMSRLLRIKGIGDAVEAVQMLRDHGEDVELTIAGAPDPGNPSSIPPSEVERWSRLPGVRCLGHVADVRPALAACHVVLQPSLGGEGLPKALLEAAAAGRALIATDVPGNREIVVAGETGWLAPAGDPAGLAKTIFAAANDLEKCRQYGLAARAKVEREFALELIRRQHAELYGSAAALDS